jgi:1-deoxy-D-xylulose-5-phosphate reductoisomerase
MTKKVTLLGSTGSIGTQALQVIKAQGYTVTGLSAGSNVGLLLQQVIAFEPAFVGVADETASKTIAPLLAELENPPILVAGQDAARLIAAESGADIVLNAIVGIAGLSATLAAIEAGADVALANKESLVAGGQLVMEAVRRKGVRLLPVDSEHSAVFQCLQDENSSKALKRIYLTASGGPFFGMQHGELELVTLQDALKHPNWAMGKKITIDSATMMNKGLELIEAMWLFGLPPQDIEVVVQRESIIHSMVEFADHSVLAQLGVPDMRIPIQYALTWPQRLAGPAPELDFKALTHLTFGSVDQEIFLCFTVCCEAAKQGGLAPCAANGANEQAVELFLQEKITFLQIGELVWQAVQQHNQKQKYTLEDVCACDAEARRSVLEMANN